MPYELHRRSHKTAYRLIQHEKDVVTAKLKDTAKAASKEDASQPATLSSIDDMIKRMETLKRKLSNLAEEEQTMHRQARARLTHVRELENIPSAADVKYDEWSKVRLNRLLVDYLLRSGCANTAQKLAKSQHIEDLVDVEAFLQCQKIKSSLKRKETKDALIWCADNKSSLKSMNNNLEYELRLQEYIEMIRTRDVTKIQQAAQYARKYIAPCEDKAFSIRAAGLLAYPPHTLVEPYMSLYAPSRWEKLSNLFLKTYHNLLSLPQNPPLHIALSAGLSALKTPSCHSSHPSPSSALNAHTIPTGSSNNTSAPGTGRKISNRQAAIGQSVCPICSTELNALARNVPYAQHTKSNVDDDPVVLPNGRVYGRAKLMAFQSKVKGVGVAGGADVSPTEDWDEIVDPADPEFKCRADQLRQCYIT